MRMFMILCLLSACTLVRVVRQKDVDKSAWSAMNQVGLYLREADQYNIQTNALYNSVLYSPGQSEADKEALSKLKPRLEQMNLSHAHITAGHAQMAQLKNNMDEVFGGGDRVSSDDPRWEKLNQLIERFKTETEVIHQAAEKYKAESDEFTKIVHARGYQEGFDANSFLAAIDDLDRQLQQNLEVLMKAQGQLNAAEKARYPVLKQEFIADQKKLPALRSRVRALVDKNPVIMKRDERYSKLETIKTELETMVRVRQASLESFRQLRQSSGT